MGSLLWQPLDKRSMSPDPSENVGVLGFLKPEGSRKAPKKQRMLGASAQHAQASLDHFLTRCSWIAAFPYMSAFIHARIFGYVAAGLFGFDSQRVLQRLWTVFMSYWGNRSRPNVSCKQALHSSASLFWILD